MGKGCTMLRKLEVKSCQREPLPCERPQESSLQRNGSGRSLLTSQRQEHPPDATRHRLDIGPRNPTGSHVRSAHCRVCWGQKGSLAWKLRSDRPAGAICRPCWWAIVKSNIPKTSHWNLHIPMLLVKRRLHVTNPPECSREQDPAMMQAIRDHKSPAHV